MLFLIIGTAVAIIKKKTGLTDFSEVRNSEYK